MTSCPFCRRTHDSSQAKVVLYLASHNVDQDPWLLPDDAVVDDEAVWVASRGERLVKMTRTERLLAATQIIEAGGTVHEVCTYLALPRDLTVDEDGPGLDHLLSHFTILIS